MKKARFLKLVPAMLLLLPFAAMAAASNANILDNVMQKYQDAASLWASVMTTAATFLFWSLAVISMVWTYGMLALKRSDISEFFVETIRYFVTTGFFWVLLINAPAIGKAIIDSMRQLAAQALGQSISSPSSVVDHGFEVFFKVLDQSSVWSPVDSMIGVLLGLGILISLALVASNMLITLVSAWMLTYGGIFYLGFGGGRWTQDIAISFYKHLIGVGMQLLAMVLLVGVGQSFVDQYYNAMSTGVSLKDMAVLLICALVLLKLVNTVPGMLGAVMGTGAPAGNAGAGTALAAMGVAAAAAAGAAALVSSGAANMAGGASALNEAFKSAMDGMNEGGASLTGSSGGDGGDGGDGGGGGGGSGSGSGGSKGFASAMSSAGKFAASVGTQLAKGAAQVAKEKSANAVDAAKERISETAGGQVAKAISSDRSARAAQKSETPLPDISSFDASGAGAAPSFDGDSLGAGMDTMNEGSNGNGAPTGANVGEASPSTASGADAGLPSLSDMSPEAAEEVSDFVNKRNSEAA